MIRLALLCLVTVHAHAAAPKTRVLVMTDISTLTSNQAEPDDTQSLIRFLLYTNHFDVEGLIATHTDHDLPQKVNPQYIHLILDTYAKVQPNLILHDPDFPTAQYLHERVKAGSADRSAIGEGHDTEASDWIIQAVDRQDPRPLWFSIWGGARELAQALWKVDRTRDARQVREFEAKIRAYATYDQDGTGKWIAEHHPNLFYITSSDTVRGMYRDGDTSLVGPEWVERHILNGHGELGAAYPMYHGGDPWGRVNGIKEGDSPAFLYLIPNGLGVPEEPGLGSWGGRFTGPGPRYTGRERETVFRWREAYQNSFAARLEWCVRKPADANHEPVAVIEGPAERPVKTGGHVSLDASRSHDPDGGKLSFQWEIYPPGGGSIEVQPDNPARVTVSASDRVHVLLTVTDSGTPPLTAYRRVTVFVPMKGKK